MNPRELEDRVLAALAAGDVAAWRSAWMRFEQTLRDAGADLAAAFTRTLTPTGQTALPATLRLPLLQEWLQLSGPQALPPPLVLLLNSATDTEVETLWWSNLPSAWVDQAALSVLLQGGAAPVTVSLLHTAEEGRLASFLQSLKVHHGKRDDLCERILLPLLQEAPPEYVPQLLRAGLSGSPAMIWRLLSVTGAFEGKGASFWRQPQLLELLFSSMKEHGGSTQGVWAFFTDQITEAVVVKGDPDQGRLLSRLSAACLALGAAVPPTTAETIRDWMSLRARFASAGAAQQANSAELHRACGRRGLDFVTLLREDFETSVLPRGDKVIQRFEETFHGFLPPEDDFANASHRWALWLKVVNVCPDANLRGDYQIYYLEQHIAPEYHLTLAQDAFTKKKIEKRVWKKVQADEVARQEEEQRRAAHEAALARQQEAKESVRLLRRAKRGQAWLKIAAWSAPGFLIVGLFVGLYLANSGKPPRNDAKPLKDSSVKNKDRDQDKDNEGDKDKDKDRDQVVKDNGGTKDGDTRPGLDVVPDFDTRAVETLLNALIEEAESSQRAANNFKSYTLAKDFDKVRLALTTRKNQVKGLNLNPPKTVAEWKMKTAKLTEIVNGPLLIRVGDARRDEAIKPVMDFYRNKQKELYETIRKLNIPTRPQGKEEKQILADLLLPLPAPVIAAFVEQYAQERGQLSLEALGALRSLLADYVQANAFLNGPDPDARKIIDVVKLQMIHDHLIDYVRTEAMLKGKQDPKESKKRLKDLFVANNAREVWENLAPNRKAIVKARIDALIREFDR